MVHTAQTLRPQVQQGVLGVLAVLQPTMHPSPLFPSLVPAVHLPGCLPLSEDRAPMRAVGRAIHFRLLSLRHLQSLSAPGSHNTQVLGVRLWIPRVCPEEAGVNYKTQRKCSSAATSGPGN